VVIDVPGLITVTHSSGTHTVRSILSQEAFSLSGGSLTVSNTVQVNNGFTLSGGTLVGATVLAGTNGLPIIANGGTLSGVTLASDVSIADGNSLKSANGLTLVGGAKITLNTSGNGTYLYVSPGTQSIGGAGEIVLAGSSSANYLRLGKGGATTLALGPEVTVPGAGQDQPEQQLDVAQQGTLQADVSGGTLTVSVNSFTNSGALRAVGAALSISTLAPGTMGGTLELVGSGSAVTLNGSGYALPVSGVVVGADQTLTLNGSWSNAGTLVLNGGTLNRAGSVTQAGLGTFNRTGGTVNLTGTLSGVGNLPPVGADLAFVRATDSELSINLSNLLAQCSDPNGDALSLSGVGESLQAATIFISPSNILYSLAADTPDHFDYLITDGNGGFATNAITVLVTNFYSELPMPRLETLFSPNDEANTNSTNRDKFGSSLSLDGSILVVGSQFEDYGTNDAGAAFVYDLSTGFPSTPFLVLTNPTPEPEENFGWLVANSSNLVAVASRLQINGMGAFPGEVFIYDLTSFTPELPALAITNTIYSVNALACSGNLVAVAEMDREIRVYNLTNGSPTLPWLTLTNISATNTYATGSAANWGTAIALSQGRLAVGASFYSGSPTSIYQGGSVWLYDLFGTNPTLPSLVVTNPVNEATGPSGWKLDGKAFGHAVALADNRLLVADPMHQINFGNTVYSLAEGRAYLFDLNGASPKIPVATYENPKPQANTQFGSAVAISADFASIGALGATVSDRPFAGAVHVYELTDSTLATAVLQDPTPATNSFFGAVLSASGSRVAVGHTRGR
jgi:hypothetical protein